MKFEIQVCMSIPFLHFLFAYCTLFQDSYPLPDVNEMIDVCKGRKYFTQLDLASGYWCLNVQEEDREKTAFSVPNGKFEFMRMPFGLKNSQATFQRMIDRVVNSIVQKGYDDVAAYVDNIFVFSNTFEEHLLTLKVVLEEIVKHNLSLKPEKCEIGLKDIDFLGFHIGNDAVEPCHRQDLSILLPP